MPLSALFPHVQDVEPVVEYFRPVARSISRGGLCLDIAFVDGVDVDAVTLEHAQQLVGDRATADLSKSERKLLGQLTESQDVTALGRTAIGALVGQGNA